MPAQAQAENDCDFPKFEDEREEILHSLALSNPDQLRHVSVNLNSRVGERVLPIIPEFDHDDLHQDQQIFECVM